MGSSFDVISYDNRPIQSPSFYQMTEKKESGMYAALLRFFPGNRSRV